MSAKIAEHLAKITKGSSPLEPAQWRRLISGLVDEAAEFIGTLMERDAEALIRAEEPSFSIWFWSADSNVSGLSITWSAVMSGGIVGDDRFVVAVSLFIFDGVSKSRLYTADGKHFLELVYTEKGEWVHNGWKVDEWGEWEQISFNGIANH